MTMKADVYEMFEGLEQLRCETAQKLLIELGRTHVPDGHESADQARERLVSAAVDLATRMAGRIGATRVYFAEEMEISIANALEARAHREAAMQECVLEGERERVSRMAEAGRSMLDDLRAVDPVRLVLHARRREVRTLVNGWLGQVSAILCNAFGQRAVEIEDHPWELMLEEIRRTVTEPTTAHGGPGRRSKDRASAMARIESIVAGAFKEGDAANKMSVALWDAMLSDLERAVTTSG